MSLGGAGGALVDLESLAIREYQSLLKKFVTPLKDGVRASTKVLVGTPFLEIIHKAIANKRDLVMVTAMTAEDKRGLQEQLIGIKSLHLMRMGHEATGQPDDARRSAGAGVKRVCAYVHSLMELVAARAPQK